jgi:hypothetical protein
MKMEMSIKANGKKTKRKAMANTHGRMVMSTKVIIKMVEGTVMERNTMLMATFMKVVGKKTVEMGKVHING